MPEIREVRGERMGNVPARAVLDAAMTEAQLFESVRDHLNAFGWLWYHTRDSRGSNAGFPDIVAVKKGNLLFIELKSQRGQVTKEQADWKYALQETMCAGCGSEDSVLAYIWRPSDLSSGEIERVLRS